MTNFQFYFFQDPDFFKQYHHFRDKEHENVSEIKLCYYPPVGEKGKPSTSNLENVLTKNIVLVSYFSKLHYTLFEIVQA